MALSGHILFTDCSLPTSDQSRTLAFNSESLYTPAKLKLSIHLVQWLNVLMNTILVIEVWYRVKLLL